DARAGTGQRGARRGRAERPGPGRRAAPPLRGGLDRLRRLRRAEAGTPGDTAGRLNGRQASPRGRRAGRLHVVTAAGARGGIVSEGIVSESIVSETSKLRPLERRILRMVDEGMSTDDIARRLRRSPAAVERFITLSRLPGRDAPAGRAGSLRPLERRVLRWRDRGAGYDDIGARLRHSPDFVERVEALANYKLTSA